MTIDNVYGILHSDDDLWLFPGRSLEFAKMKAREYRTARVVKVPHLTMEPYSMIGEPYVPSLYKSLGEVPNEGIQHDPLPEAPGLPGTPDTPNELPPVHATSPSHDEGRSQGDPQAPLTGGRYA